MGLDITAMSKIRAAQNPMLDEDDDVLDSSVQWNPRRFGMKWSEKNFPGHGEGVNINIVYEWEDSFSFKAGSHILYNVWRNELKKFKGDVAFQELINFADHTGVIGSVVAKKLLNDFIKYENEAEKYSKTMVVAVGYKIIFMQNYRKWKKAFELAADNGAVYFQ